jgi:DNA invertase Pin-like site-specific DNA recombinase
VFKAAILANAAAIIAIHNHPSGDPRPSAEDHTITGRLVAAGHLLGIPVLDHVVIGDEGYFSFRDAGRLDEAPEEEQQAAAVCDPGPRGDRRVGLYARVSTNDQTAENQLRALREHAERAGWTIVATYTDQAVSGTREKRPGLDALLADARRRKFDLVAVAALDRLGRNLRHLVTLLDEFQHLGIALVSLREALDLTSPIGRAMFALVGVLAEVERAWIVERTHAGLRRARAQGKKLGRPSAPIDPARLRLLLREGKSYRAAARLIGVSEGAIRLAVGRDPTLRPETLHSDRRRRDSSDACVQSSLQRLPDVARNPVK